MASVNSIRIPGLATGMDTDQMVKDMMVGEQNKVDKAHQTQQISKWKQETYRNIIKDAKGLYDKYFSTLSDDYILGSKAFSSMKITSSNNSIINATAGVGADKINYKLKVEAIAQGAKLESITFDKDKTLGELNAITSDSAKIKINDKEIEIKATDKALHVIKKINDSFPKGELKAKYSEMTGKITIETNKTGKSTELKFEGEFFKNIGMSNTETGAVNGSNNRITVYDGDGITEIKKIESESNSFSIDNITYEVKGVSSELASMTSEKDTKNTTDRVKGFIKEYNKIIDNVYDIVREKKNRDYPPLTEAQKKDMDEDEIKKWEEKAKAGILRNDSELRNFMEEIRNITFTSLDGVGINVSDIGIRSHEDYNKQGQLSLDEAKFKKALKENEELAYKATTATFEKIKDITYKYAGSSSSIFVKKAGVEKSSTEINNLFSIEIRKQEQYIKDLTTKMKRKEKSLYAKFATLESSMNKLNSQMSYLSSSLG